MSFDAPTLYTLLLAVTWAVHFHLAASVAVGTGWLFLASLRGRPSGAVERVLRDWLPFLLSAAITAGVAPLLFVQVLFGRGFYTANLLLFHRWMAILPALVVGFYLLYALKSGFDRRGGVARRVLVPGLAFGCFLFVGWSWSENHVLALADQETWVARFVEGGGLAPSSRAVGRLALLAGAAVTLAATQALAQLATSPSCCADLPPEELRRAERSLARAALAGLVLLAVLFGLAAAGTGAWSHPHGAARGVLGPALLRSGATAIVSGLAASLLAWLPRLRRTGGGAVGVAVLGASLLALGLGLAREGLRLARIPEQAFRAHVDDVATTAGLTVFLVSLVACAALATWAVRLTAPARRAK